jgi:glycerol 3-phosphatase-2
LGDCLTSSLNANVPQFVSTVTVYVRRGSSFAVGAFRCPGGLGFGTATVRHWAPVAAGAVAGSGAAGFAWVVVVALWLDELPHPDRASTAAIAIGVRRIARKKSTPRRNNPHSPPMSLSPLLERYDHVLLDLDGCVWVGDECTRGAPAAIAELRAAGKSLAFLTNDPRRAPEDFVRKLWSLGVQASLEEVVTVGAAIQYVLAERAPRTTAYVIGSNAIFRHVGEAGVRIVNRTELATAADVVVIAGHDDFNFDELRDATQAVLAGAEMLAAGRDRTFPVEGGMWPATGAIVAALEYATDRGAHSIGKPDPQMFNTALDRLGPGRALVVGDRVDSDLAGAAAAGLDGAIVLTGVSDRATAEAAAEPAAVAVADDLHALVVAR